MHKVNSARIENVGVIVRVDEQTECCVVVVLVPISSGQVRIN